MTVLHGQFARDHADLKAIGLAELRGSLESCESFVSYVQGMVDELPADSPERPFAEHTLVAARGQAERRRLAVRAAERLLAPSQASGNNPEDPSLGAAASGPYSGTRGSGSQASREDGAAWERGAVLSLREQGS